MSRFTITRRDGRSHAEVLIAFVQAATPGQTYTYADLRGALSAGTDRVWTDRAIQSAIISARPKMLRETHRILHAVRGVGYRLALGSDHSRLALAKERKGQRQINDAVAVLKHVQWDEMSPAQRVLHEAHLTITAAVYAQVMAVQRRQRKHDAAIDALVARVDRLESTPSA